MFYSILFCNKEQHDQPRQSKEPAYFKDLNLGQIVSPILEAKKEFHLDAFFYTTLRDQDTILYRQNVMRELKDQKLRSLLTAFSKTLYGISRDMDTARRALLSHNSLDNNYLTRGQLLDCAEQYCGAVSDLNQELSEYTLYSEGLREFAEYLSQYGQSEHYTELCAQIKHLRQELSTVKYCMLIHNGTIHVRKYEGQEEFSPQILNAFDKFRQGEVRNYQHTAPEKPPAAHVEAAVLNMVAKLYPEIFADLNEFCTQYLHFNDETLSRFSREIQFYLSWLEYIQPFRDAGLPFNYPFVCDTPDHLYVKDGFDLALANQRKAQIVTNDFELHTPEQILVVTGPNQGGKTTYARMFGQIHYLSALGLCVPGRKASLYLFDQIFTHCEREENLSALSGKLQDDLMRLHEILEKATAQSILIFNEIFSSTTLSDALALGGHMMDAILSLGAPAVIVTFLDELALYGPETVSMMSTVRKENPSERTFKIIRKPPDGLAYALYIAGKHGLTYEQLSRRIQNESTSDV